MSVNLEAMSRIDTTSEPQLQLVKTLWLEKKRLDTALRLYSAGPLAQEHLEAIIKVFESHWLRIDHATINLGHEAVTSRYKESRKLAQESKARLFEVTHWLTLMGFEKADTFYPETERSGMNSHVMAKGEINFAINEGIDGAGESQISEFVRRWGEGIQHLAIDAKAVLPYPVPRTMLRELKMPENVGKDEGARIQALAVMLKNAGFSFLTKIYEGIAADGQKLWQCFTDEIDNGFFFELIEREGKRGRFVPGTVQGLYEDVERKRGEQ